MDSKLLEEPIGNTCPDIDRVIKHMDKAEAYLSEAEKSADYAKRQIDDKDHDYINDILDAIQSAQNEIYGLSDKLEELRRDNERLRAWGRELVEEVEYLEGK